MIHFILRRPEKKDAAEIYALLQPYKPYVGTSPCYTYLLICEHFRDTSAVAIKAGGEIIGFTSAYYPPNKPNNLFLWEIGVKKGYHGNQLYIHMVQAIYERCRPMYIEATVNPSNTSSIKRLKKLANLFNSDLTTDILFPSKCFGKQDHEDEVLYCIGPISS